MLNAIRLLRYVDSMLYMYFHFCELKNIFVRAISEKNGVTGWNFLLPHPQIWNRSCCPFPL